MTNDDDADKDNLMIMEQQNMELLVVCASINNTLTMSWWTQSDQNFVNPSLSHVLTDSCGAGFRSKEVGIQIHHCKQEQQSQQDDYYCMRTVLLLEVAYEDGGICGFKLDWAVLCGMLRGEGWYLICCFI